MRLLKITAAAALAIAASACGQGNSDNVMSPEANALEPADVNAALGPEVTATPEANTTNDASALDNGVTNSPAVTEIPANNAAE